MAARSTAPACWVREYTGRGPTNINQESAVVLLQDTLTKAERRLAENGKADHVMRGRHGFQVVMQADLIHIIEQETGRKVIAFMSANHFDPDMAVEVFVFEPSGDTDPAGYDG